MKDLIIIGAGPAGMTAAIYASSAGLSVILLERAMYGGQMATTAKIENYPGYREISGWQLSHEMIEQVNAAGIALTYDHVRSIEDRGDIKRVIGEEGDYEARAVIIANGVQRRRLGCPGEEELAGRGVSYCAVCDGAFFRRKTVAVVGGGNSALEDAVYLSGICEKVYLIHRRHEFRADERDVQGVMRRENIEVIYSHTVTGIHGRRSVEGITLKDLSDDSNKELPVNGVFIAIGLSSDNERFSDVVTLSEGGYILTDDHCATTGSGIYAAGDTRDKILRQIVSATADGALAAKGAMEYIRNIKK